ncbi:MAG: hypothetical protein LBR29_03290 [Methylobacteriaceae bacterium]|jgi:hypothetical protein|nr:hypothetical protein [Methylobacteriaceae bacterium]
MFDLQSALNVGAISPVAVSPYSAREPRGQYLSETDYIVCDNPPTIPQTSVTTVSGGDPGLNWRTALVNKLIDLISLPVGWDGYQGRPVSREIAELIVNLLQDIAVPGTPLPDIIPGSDGTAQIEWHTEKYDLEIDVLSKDGIFAWRNHIENDREEEFAAKTETDLVALRRWVRELSEQDLPHETA